MILLKKCILPCLILLVYVNIVFSNIFQIYLLFTVKNMNDSLFKRGLEELAAATSTVKFPSLLVIVHLYL